MGNEGPILEDDGASNRNVGFIDGLSQAGIKNSFDHVETTIKQEGLVNSARVL